ncbi:fam-a protein [Plasmodium chabaudi chabaudi]|uniref:Fam-a protein n=1 Tax=Plasmodium chabaudi chabaudi TaxID=31271 RepID=A0A1C6WQ92_PLACU|nr:fam-a protein [Plasmodium chabaudi chabaudi]
MNKFYTQIIFLLLSITIYVNNETLATEPASKENATKPASKENATKPASKENATEPASEENATPPLSHRDRAEEIYEENKHLLCINPEEIINADKLMNEAVKHLKMHATTINSYEMCGFSLYDGVSYYKKIYKNHTQISKAHLIVCNPNKYNEIIKMLWDPGLKNYFNNGSVKISRVYNPNLVMIQQRYKKKLGRRQKYFYALAKKVEISDDTTIITMTSANINDHNPSDEEYKNTIVESANLFTTDIDSEDDIRKGKLKKVFVNLAGYLIEKKSYYVYVTYVESINGHTSIKPIWGDNAPLIDMFPHLNLYEP